MKNLLIYKLFSYDFADFSNRTPATWEAPDSDMRWRGYVWESQRQKEGKQGWKMPFTENNRRDRKRKTGIFRMGLLLCLLLFFGNSRVYAAEATVTFGEESYSVEEDTFEIEVYVRAEGSIGVYQVILRYDAGRMEYLSGAEEVSEDRIVLEGTGFGSEVAYVLEFRSAGAGSAGLAVEEARIYPAGEEEEGYTVSTLARVPVEIQGQETGEPSFFARLDEETQSMLPGSAAGFGTNIPIMGSITDAGGNILYLIDMADYEPDITLWDYTLVTGSYLEDTFTYISDKGRNIRAVLTMDENGSLRLYAYRADTHNFYPVNRMEVEGKDFYILSPGACINIPTEMTEEEIDAGTVFYAVDAAGVGGYYRYTTAGALEEWEPETTDAWKETGEEMTGQLRSIVFVALVVLGAGLIVAVLLILWKKAGASFLKNRLKALMAYYEDKKQYIFVIKELTGREVKRKYARSHLGIVWSVLNPLLMMIVMSMIFSYMFKRSIDNFPLYYLTGSLLWGLFSTGTSSAMSALVDNKTLLIKAKLPRQTFVISRMLTALVNMGYSFVPYVLMLAVFRIRPSWTMLFLPLDVILICAFTMGIGYILSILYVFFADIKYLYSLFLTILTYLTALFYPVTALPDTIQKVVGYNPVYLSIYIARECMVYGRVPHYSAWVKLTLAAVFSFLTGWIVFKKEQNNVMQRI